MPHKDPEQGRAYHRAYHEQNKARDNARNRAWYAKNREAVLARKAAWTKEHPGYFNKKSYHVKFRYGLSEQDRLELFESSDGLCALCYEVPATHIDHDHDTERVRGALCQLCNQGLGHVQRMGATSPAIAEYLATEWRAA